METADNLISQLPGLHFLEDVDFLWIHAQTRQIGNLGFVAELSDFRNAVSLFPADDVVKLKGELFGWRIHTNGCECRNLPRVGDLRKLGNKLSRVKSGNVGLGKTQILAQEIFCSVGLGLTRCKRSDTNSNRCKADPDELHLSLVVSRTHRIVGNDDEPELIVYKIENSRKVLTAVIKPRISIVRKFSVLPRSVLVIPTAQPGRFLTE